MSMSLSCSSIHLATVDSDMLIRFCCYSQQEYAVYRKVAYELRIRYAPGSFEE